MSVKGLGTDIIQIDRIERHVAKSDALARRVLTDYELTLFADSAQPRTLFS